MATKGGGLGKSTAPEALKRKYVAPLAFYRLKDMAIDVVQKETFFDTVIITLAFIAILFALPFYPVLVAVILVALLFAAAIYHPFLGIIVMLILAMPALIYQAPAIAWLGMLAIALILVFGYKYYRTITFALMATALSFSQLGYLFIIPTVALSTLILGRKREVIMLLLFVGGVVALSGLTGVQNNSYLLYSPSANTIALNKLGVLQYVTPNKPIPSLFDFPMAFAGSVGAFFTLSVALTSTALTGYAVSAFTSGQVAYVFQLAALLVIVLAIDEFVVTSRSKYRGVEASSFVALYGIYYILVSGIPQNIGTYLTIAISILIAPFVVYGLQLYDVDIVKALDVRKSDVRMKFGEAFEDLQFGTSLERFKDIGDYEATKLELKSAVLDPIESRSIARAYNITPAKGLLFFGPPGTGKTMMMRALANEVHAAFFYVKASNLLSAYLGESERRIAGIFTIAKKHLPCVLFFDEIDAIGTDRERAADEARSKALSQLLIELDGFQKLERVIFVGATNVPDMLDPALLRAGRIDKAIYMPLPNAKARKEIFEIYLRRYPLADGIDISEITAKTERYSGADIKLICNTVAQTVAQEAAAEHKILGITEKDILESISEIKPSTSLAQLERYEKFRVRFERSVHAEGRERASSLSISSVVGLDDIKKVLVEAIQIPLLHPDLVERYRIKAIKGVLMFGPPGNGKTMLMKAAINDEALKGVQMLTINGSELSEQGIEKANATMKEVFNTARENEPALIFIDEIDGIAPARGKGGWLTSEITTELLKQMDGLDKPYGIIVVAATNRPAVLDAALLRPGRFDKIIFVGLPNAEERAQLFKIYLTGLPAQDLDFSVLGNASEGYSSADITDICREVKARVLEEAVKTGEDTKISNADVIAVVKQAKPSVSKAGLREFMDFAARYERK